MSPSLHRSGRRALSLQPGSCPPDLDVPWSFGFLGKDQIFPVPAEQPVSFCAYKVQQQQVGHYIQTLLSIHRPRPVVLEPSESAACVAGLHRVHALGLGAALLLGVHLPAGAAPSQSWVQSFPNPGLWPVLSAQQLPTTSCCGAWWTMGGCGSICVQPVLHHCCLLPVGLLRLGPGQSASGCPPGLWPPALGLLDAVPCPGIHFCPLFLWGGVPAGLDMGLHPGS